MSAGSCPSAPNSIWKDIQLPNFQPNEFPPNQWVLVLDWRGITLQTLVHRVSATPATAVVKWRRSGPLPLQVAQGTFQGQVDFNVYPTDTNLQVELWVDDPDIEIEVTFTGALAYTAPGP